MDSPAEYAIIPDFLHFQIRDLFVAQGTVHADYAQLQRSIEAELIAEPGQEITSSSGGLEQLKGRLVIAEISDLDRDWTGSITRSQLRATSPLSAVKDYQVDLDLDPSGFSGLLELMRRDEPWTSLLLNFQGIDCPVIDDPMDGPIPWDDVTYPSVLLTSFRLTSGLRPRLAR